MESAQEIPKEIERTGLDNTMDTIKRNCKNPEQGGFVFIKKDRMTKTDQAANTLCNGLAYTLQEIGRFSVGEAKNQGPEAQEYKTVAEAVELMTVAFNGLSEGRIPLKRNNFEEASRSTVGDKIYAFEAYKFDLNDGENNRPFNRISIFIRPEKYEKNIHHNQGAKKTPSIDLKEVREPRMNIKIWPKDASTGEIDIRIDKDDKGEGNEITYDIVVGGDNNVVDHLHFSSEENPTQANQRHGHHFNSNINTSQYGTDFRSVMNAINGSILDKMARFRPRK